MAGLVLGLVIAAAVNLITALFSRQKAVRLLPWLLLYICLHATVAGLNADSVRGKLIGIAHKHPAHWTYIPVLLAGAIVAGIYWFAINGIVEKTNAVTTEPQQPPTGIVPLTDEQLKKLVDGLSKGDSTARPSQNVEQESSALDSDLRFTFYGKDLLYYAYSNPTRRVANKPTIAFGLCDLSNPYKYATNGVVRSQPFPVPTKVMDGDYVRPGEAGGDQVLGQFMSHIKPGDVIYGAAWLTCINCKKRRGYYVYWKVGDGGWYSEVPLKGMQLPALLDRGYTDSEIEDYVNRMVPPERRKKMKQQFTGT